jgi:hypothetical protein
MKRFLSMLAAVLMLASSGLAFAQATTITTACPASFTCAFSAAESLAFGTPRNVGSPGQPSVFIGYMVFDASSSVTLAGLQNVNGTVGPIGSGSPAGLSSPGACAPGASGQPALITFNDKSQIAFVVDSTGTELQFILSKDISSTANGSTTNSVRVGVCRKQ